MYLLSYKEREKLSEKGIKLFLYDQRSMKLEDIQLNEAPDRGLLAFRGHTARTTANGGIRPHTLAETIQFVPIVDGQLLKGFPARVGSFYDYGDRRFANYYRRHALKQAQKVLGL